VLVCIQFGKEVNACWGAMLSSEPGITVMDFWMYVDFVYGILFDGSIITRKTRKHANQRFARKAKPCSAEGEPAGSPRLS